MNEFFGARAMASIGLATMMCATIGGVGNAQAKENKPYVALSLGVSDPSSVKDSVNATTRANNGTRVSVILGYGVGKNFRTEAELFHVKNTADTLTLASLNGGNPQTATGSISAVGLMANGYYDFKTKMAIVPYVGAGVGLTKVSVNDVVAPGLSGTDDSDRVLAWQFMAGVSYPVSDAVDLTLGYRFFSTRDISLTSKNGTAYTSDGPRVQSLEIGVRYGF